MRSKQDILTKDFLLRGIQALGGRPNVSELACWVGAETGEKMAYATVKKYAIANGLEGMMRIPHLKPEDIANARNLPGGYRDVIKEYRRKISELFGGGAETREIPGFTGYFARTDGKIFTGKSGELAEMTASVHQNGYRMYNLVGDDGKRRVQTAGRWILETFEPNEEGERLQVTYKDGDKSNCGLDNLAWVTHRQTLAKRGKHRAKNMRREPVYAFYDDGRIEKFLSRADIDFIGKSTIAHMLSTSDKTNYGTHHSRKYGCSLYYFAQMDENQKDRVYKWEAERPLY